MKPENALPLAASVTFWVSRTRPGTLINWGTGAISLVSLLIMIAVPTPQLGWQPQLKDPQSEFGPCAKSAKSAKTDISEIGNQSRVGSVIPACSFTSLAMCDRV